MVPYLRHCLHFMMDYNTSAELNVPGSVYILEQYALSTCCPKPSGKLRRLTPSFGCTLAVRLKKYFFRNKTFLFFKLESWNFQVQFEIKIRESSQNFNSFSFFRQLLFSSFFIGCLIELKFYEVSRNSISNWTWKFQPSILKNKKVLFLKKKF